ncbi:MAG: GxxExxY protein [Chloroflexota bacterium]
MTQQQPQGNGPQIDADFSQIDLVRTPLSKAYPDKELTERVIGAAFEVHRELGSGFLERVYEVALLREFASRGVSAASQVPLPVLYKGTPVGMYYADILVEKRIILEIKAATSIESAHEAQVLHYLTATGLRLALILNFGTPSVQVKRIVKSK